MDLVSRICKSYKCSLDNEEKERELNSQDSMWIHWIKPKLNDILMDCYNNNVENTRYNLSNPYKNNITFGFDDYNIFNTFNELETFNNEIKNCIIKLCKSLGLLRVFNPEGGERSDLYNINIDIEEILLLLDDYFGFKIDFPDIFEKDNSYNWLSYVNSNKDLQNAGITTKEIANHHYSKYGKYEKRKYNGDMGIFTSRGIIKMRTVHSLHFISRIKEILNDNIKNSTILEIGAGLGRNAYYAKKLGVKKYIIIDLPSTSIMSSYYLGKTLGEENITLYSENTDNYVHILPPNEYNNTKADIIVQFDGLTEMGLVNSEKYINNFINISPLFLSINHEANTYTVNNLYEKKENITRIYRFPSWYRDGYVEELLKRKKQNVDNS
jgi:hypothetical protein